MIYRCCCFPMHCKYCQLKNKQITNKLHNFQFRKAATRNCAVIMDIQKINDFFINKQYNSTKNRSYHQILHTNKRKYQNLPTHYRPTTTKIFKINKPQPPILYVLIKMHKKEYLYTHSSPISLMHIPIILLHRLTNLVIIWINSLHST